MFVWLLNPSRIFAIILLVTGMVIIVFVGLINVSPAHALPEYSTRTGEPCATCHVSPGGGGPRTMRGLLWVGANRPAEVPELEGILLAPGIDDPQALYDIACSSCHGRQGEGLSAVSLVDFSLSSGSVERIVTRGADRSGMPAFEGQLTEDQIQLLVEYVIALNTGEIIPVDNYPLPPAMLTRETSSSQSFSDRRN